MVKKFIQGLLKKGEGDSTTAKEEEVPDELPPLAEDTIHHEEEPVEKKEEAEESPHPKDFSDLEHKEEKKESKEEESKEPKITDAQTLQTEMEPPKESTLEPQATKPEPTLLDSTDSQVLTTLSPSDTMDSPLLDKSPQADDPSFFSEVLDLMKEQGIKDKVLRQDLYTKMRDFWYFHPQGKGKIKSKEQLEQEIYEELKQLRKLEERWIAQKKFLEEDRRILAEKGRDIQNRIHQLQMVLSQLKLYEDVTNNRYFMLNNNIVVKNVHDLMNALELIDEQTFEHHVSHHKNDFSHWIKYAVGNEDLAGKCKKAKSRTELIAILENELLGHIDSIQPDQYFKMNNGAVIRNLHELQEALVDANEQTIKSHMRSHSNDFAKWVREVFKNNIVADKLQHAKTRDELIAVLKEI